MTSFSRSARPSCATWETWVGSDARRPIDAEACQVRTAALRLRVEAACGVEDRAAQVGFSRRTRRFTPRPMLDVRGTPTSATELPGCPDCEPSFTFDTITAYTAPTVS